MIVYSEKITPRLQYITDFIGKEITGKPFELTDDIDVFKNYNGPKINYSNAAMGNGLPITIGMAIGNCGLLSETRITDQKIECFEVNGFKAFFKTTGDYPFDIFAASFYLLSRYEEYLPHQTDMYGRYAHKNSLAYKEGFLNLPLVNIWIENFKKVIKKKFPSLNIKLSIFRFLPTYDIDEAWSYLYKDAMRTAGGLAKQILTGKWSLAMERVLVICKQKQDPFDAYAWMNALHEKYRLLPVYFFVVPEKNGQYDKNILPPQPAMQQLIKQHAGKYSIGIHPSWQSGDDESLLKREIETLERISENRITASRQHYIRFNLPMGYRKLTDAGISDDYSMGYGSINGFRASVASSFFWYDLEKEESTPLLIHPFCFMEANSFFEQKFSPAQALAELMHYSNAVKSVNGCLITIWHNTFLGTGKLYSGWQDVYRQFVENISSSDSNY